MNEPRRVDVPKSHGLGIKLIAEGVETQAQLNFLVKAGCDEIQGYYYSKPLLESELESFFKNEKKLLF